MKSGRIFFGLIFFLVVACPALAQEVGKIMSIVGTAEVLRKEQWQSVSLHETLQAGDVVRTGPGSRLAVLLADGSQIKVNANSRLALKQVALPTRRVAMRLIQSLLRLFRGEIWVRSLGEPLEVETLAAVATIRGTELNLAVGPTDTARLAVVEGVVEFHNPEGSVRVGAQEQALARVGEAPRKTVLLNPLDAVQWSLYYPGIVSYRDYSLAEIGPALLQKQLTELERRLATDPQDVNAVIALGEALFDLGKRMEARTQFEKALRLAPRDPRAHTGRGWVYLEAGESEAALRQFHQAEPSTLMSLVGKAHALYRLNRFEETLEVIARAKQRFPKSPRPWTQAALIYLVQGRVPGALAELDRALRLDPKYALAHGLRSNIYLVRNQKERALEAAQQAVAANPFSPAAHLDLSLVKQAEFKLKEALQAARKAVALDPENPQALIQVSRLLFGDGDVDEAFKLAERARRLAPQDQVVLSTWGFLQLARERVNEAIAAFDLAIVQDSTRGEPHLGKGLALFRRGKTEDGVKEMRIATLLEPKVSLYHSYLGKAFYEVKEDKLTEQQLALAKELDPRDPTPHFYDAIRKQSVNRPVEALQDLQKSIELNDNRAVYRSRFLLDEDLAARGAALGRIYREQGFQQLALVEGWKSLSQDPTNYTAHRLLSDSYSVLPRHEIARVSELLQSQLLQPINITPVQPQLAESDLFLLGGLGPAEPSLNEFNSLFQRNRFSLLASGLIGSNKTYSDEVVHSGIWNNFSYSLGQFHYENDGFRENNDLEEDIYNIFLQGAITSRLNLQVEFRRRDREQGDLPLNFDPENFDRELRRTIDQDTVRLGARYSLWPKSDLLVSGVYTDRDESLSSFNLKDRRDGYQIEARYLLQHDWLSATIGGGSYRIDTNRHIEFSEGPPFDEDFRDEHDNTYFYVDLRFPRTMTWTFGLSHDAFTSINKDIKKLKPKVGLQWDLTRWARLRLAYFQTVKRTQAVDQTIEPTQIAGFNQFFDDDNGTETSRYGAGLDVVFSDKLYGGLEYTRRDLEVPSSLADLATGIATRVTFEREEELARGYIYWTPRDYLAVSGEAEFERFERSPSDLSVTEGGAPTDVETIAVPLAVRYFSPSGFFAAVGGTFVRQDVELAPTSAFARDSDEFFLVDASIGYRLPKRRGLISLEAKNLFDDDFLYQDLNIQSARAAQYPRFVPDRTVFLRATFAFH
jgi:tetratricopeptide (TPR) repeat protein